MLEAVNLRYLDSVRPSPMLVVALVALLVFACTPLATAFFFPAWSGLVFLNWNGLLFLMLAINPPPAKMADFGDKFWSGSMVVTLWAFFNVIAFELSAWLGAAAFISYLISAVMLLRRA